MLNVLWREKAWRPHNMNPFSLQTPSSWRLLDRRHSLSTLFLSPQHCIHCYIGVLGWRALDQEHGWTRFDSYLQTVSGLRLRIIVFLGFMKSVKMIFLFHLIVPWSSARPAAHLSLRNQSCCILNLEQWDSLALCNRANSSPCVQCGLMECLNNMLLKWLTWHSVYALEDDLDISLNSHTSMWASQPHARRPLVKTHSTNWHVATFAKWWFSVSRRLLWVTNHSVCPPAQLFKTFGESRDYQPATTWIRISWTALANYGRLFIRKSSHSPDLYHLLPPDNQNN